MIRQSQEQLKQEKELQAKEHQEMIQRFAQQQEK